MGCREIPVLCVLCVLCGWPFFSIRAETEEAFEARLEKEWERMWRDGAPLDEIERKIAEMRAEHAEGEPTPPNPPAGRDPSAPLEELLRMVSDKVERIEAPPFLKRKVEREIGEWAGEQRRLWERSDRQGRSGLLLQALVFAYPTGAALDAWCARHAVEASTARDFLARHVDPTLGLDISALASRRRVPKPDIDAFTDRWRSLQKDRSPENVERLRNLVRYSILKFEPDRETQDAWLGRAGGSDESFRAWLLEDLGCSFLRRAAAGHATAGQIEEHLDDLASCDECRGSRNRSARRIRKILERLARR